MNTSDFAQSRLIVRLYELCQDLLSPITSGTGRVSTQVDCESFNVVELCDRRTWLLQVTCNGKEISGAYL